MHANKIKTAIPSKKEKEKTTKLKATATKLAKNHPKVLRALQKLQPKKETAETELNEMETRRKINAMIT